LKGRADSEVYFEEYKMLQNRMPSEIVDSATSYGLGWMAVMLATLLDVAATAQAITVVLACLVVLVRLAYDGLKLWRYWRNRKE
jgi:hypothetical protein